MLVYITRKNNICYHLLNCCLWKVLHKFSLLVQTRHHLSCHVFLGVLIADSYSKILSNQKLSLKAHTSDNFLMFHNGLSTMRIVRIMTSNEVRILTMDRRRDF